MTIFAANLERGMYIEVEGGVFVVKDSRYAKFGKGASFIQVDAEDVMTGVSRELRFHPMERVEEADPNLVAMLIQYHQTRIE